jgi:hypothetical protein
MPAGTVQPSAAYHKHHHNKHLGIGIVGGFLLGTTLAQSRTIYIDENGGSWHVRRCLTAIRVPIRTRTPMSATTATVIAAGFERTVSGNRKKCTPRPLFLVWRVAPLALTASGP